MSKRPVIEPSATRPLPSELPAAGPLAPERRPAKRQTPELPAGGPLMAGPLVPGSEPPESPVSELRAAERAVPKPLVRRRLGLERPAPEASAPELPAAEPCAAERAASGPHASRPLAPESGPSEPRAGEGPAGEGLPGRLVLVVGPSGAGKDTLIAAARAALAGDPRYVFPRRVVTRPPSAAEDNVAADEAGFRAAAERGAFALVWAAHGHHYGIPATIRADLAAGRTVVVNVSRGVVAEARRRWPNVAVVAVTAPPEMLARRIAERARPSDHAAPDRLARRFAPADRLAADTAIDNSGALEGAVTAFLTAIAGD